MDQLDRRAVETCAVAQIAVSRNPDGPAQGEVKPPGRQRPQPSALLDESVADDEVAGGVAAPVRDLVTPVGVDLVKLGERAKPPGGPEPGLEIADRALD